MRVERAFILALIALSAVVMVTLLLQEPSNGQGVPHPEFETLRSGGSGALRHAHLLGLGWAFGGLQFVLFVLLLALGARNRSGLRGLTVPLCVSAAACLAIWSALVLAYHRYIAEPSEALFLSLPAPTAWMLFGLWPVPLLFVFLYAWGFRRWIYSPEDRRRFESLLAQRKRPPEGG